MNLRTSNHQAFGEASRSGATPESSGVKKKTSRLDVGDRRLSFEDAKLLELKKRFVIRSLTRFSTAWNLDIVMRGHDA